MFPQFVDCTKMAFDSNHAAENPSIGAFWSSSSAMLIVAVKNRGIEEG